jgi:prevent-host-death family protein
MRSLSITEARSDLAETVNRVAYGGERIQILKHGKPVAAIVSAEDLAVLIELEDRLDVIEAEHVMENSEGTVSFEKAKAELLG